MDQERSKGGTNGSNRSQRAKGRTEGTGGHRGQFYKDVCACGRARAREYVILSWPSHVSRK